ncbi:hypothetical protein Droror1_Dr00002466 [Drosera rotundifolia]
MEELVISNSDSNSNCMLSVMIRRAVSSLLNSRPKKLEYAMDRIGEDGAKGGSIGSLVESLSLLEKYVRDAAEREETVNDVLVPMIEHSLKCKNSKHANQAMILLNWLLQDKSLFESLARNLANLINFKEDHYIALGWCILVRDLVDYDKSVVQHQMSGIRMRHHSLLMILCSSVPQLSLIVCNGSVLQNGFELPTRLALAAVDCILTLTQAIAKGSLGSKNDFERSRSSDVATSSEPTSTSSGKPRAKGKEQLDDLSISEMGMLLWENLEELIAVILKLNAWSRKSRPLHAEGAGLVLQWLQGVKTYYGCRDEAGSKVPNAGVLLVASCWKHYSMLLRLDDREILQNSTDLLDQYLSGIEFYSDVGTAEQTADSSSSSETIKFFLNCLALLLGRLDSNRLACVMLEHELRISDVLLSQFHCADVKVMDEAGCIFRLLFFKMTGGSVSSAEQMKTLLPKLFKLLDELDGASRAFTELIAEYCSITADFCCVQEVLKRLASGSSMQRRNAGDIISDVIKMFPDSNKELSESFMQDIANHLLDQLSGEDTLVRSHVAELLALIDPRFVLPSLVRLMCSSNESTPLADSYGITLVEVLKHHNQNFEAIGLLLDCLSSISQSQDHPRVSAKMVESLSNLDVDRVLQLIPEWSNSVKDWTPLISPLMENTFSQSSNATIIRFLSSISEHLADSADFVLGRVLLQAKSQKEIGRNVLSMGESKPDGNTDMILLQQMLFDRLCPLLIIKLLPLRVFDDLLSTVMYGRSLHPGVTLSSSFSEYDCIAAFLLNRALHEFEFDSVRKLAAELCGRIHPQVLFLVALSQLEGAIEMKDTLKIKACLFSVCTSLAIRGWDAVSHPVISKIVSALHSILFWPSTDGDEVSKAQHGCIDCLALMICAELQVPKPSQDSASASFSSRGSAASGRTVLSSVIDLFTNENVENELHSEVTRNCSPQMLIPSRLCMANVLISVCQKISEPGKKTFVKRTFPRLIPAIQESTDPHVRAAGIQVLFSSVYHLKSAILPYASDFLSLSLKSLRKGTDKEKMAAAKLMASLMASDGAVVERISEGLLDAQSALLDVATSDLSVEVREICRKLLGCLTS